LLRDNIARKNEEMFNVFEKIEMNAHVSVFQEDFETRTVNTLPPGFSIIYNGAGNAYQVVTDSYASNGSKSFTAQGASSWSAYITIAANVSNDVLNLTAYLMSETRTDIVSGDWSDIRIGFTNPTIGMWGTYYGDIRFMDNGSIALFGGRDGPIKWLTTWNAYQWYEISIIVNKSASTADGYVDGVFYGSILIESDPYNMNSVYVGAGWTGVVGYVDDIKLIHAISQQIENSPTITHPADISYNLGAIGNQISWTITDASTGTTSYTIFRNSTSITSGSWTSGVPITESVEGLGVGSYNYTIIATDGLGGSVQDTVIVKIVSNSTPTDWLLMIFITSGVAVIVVFGMNLTRKKRARSKKSKKSMVLPAPGWNIQPLPKQHYDLDEQIRSDASTSKIEVKVPIIDKQKNPVPLVSDYVDNRVEETPSPFEYQKQDSFKCIACKKTCAVEDNAPCPSCTNSLCKRCAGEITKCPACGYEYPILSNSFVNKDIIILSDKVSAALLELWTKHKLEKETIDSTFDVFCSLKSDTDRLAHLDMLDVLFTNDVQDIDDVNEGDDLDQDDGIEVRFE